jgi:hypothetical protein
VLTHRTMTTMAAASEVAASLADSVPAQPKLPAPV